MLWQFLSLNAAVAEQNPAGNVVSLVVTAVVSATVFSALITGLVQFIMNRRNSRITERKNAIDAESDLVTRYKDAAAEERAAKESAVRTIKELLGDSREQVEVLKGTVDALNNTIRLMENLNTTQRDIIDQLTTDRDKTQAALERAEARIETQKAQLLQKQEEIQKLLEQTRTREDAARIALATFGTDEDVVD